MDKTQTCSGHIWDIETYPWDIETFKLITETLKYWVGVHPGQSYLREEGASLALVGHPSSEGVTIKMPYGVDVLHWPASHPIFSYWVG